MISVATVTSTMQHFHVVLFSYIFICLFCLEAVQCIVLDTHLPQYFPTELIKWVAVSLRNVALAPMLVTLSGLWLPSALCIQHGAVAPRGREGGRSEEGGRGRYVWKREWGKEQETKTSYGHTYHLPIYICNVGQAHTPLCQWKISTVVKRVKSQAGSLCVCVFVRERQRQVGQFMWQAAKRFNYPLRNPPPAAIPRHTDKYTLMKGGGAVQLWTAESRAAAPPPSTSLLLTPVTYIPFLPSILHF